MQLRYITWKPCFVFVCFLTLYLEVTALAEKLHLHKQNKTKQKPAQRTLYALHLYPLMMITLPNCSALRLVSTRREPQSVCAHAGPQVCEAWPVSLNTG